MILTRPIGIDLGTTNSAVAMLDPDDRELVLCRDAQGRSTTPSCVWCDPKTGEVVVGHKAYARRGSSPEPVTSIKRSMGSRIDVGLGRALHSPAEISALILAELRRQMQDELARRAGAGVSYNVTPAIVTVPAYFDLPAIEATRLAAESAGLKVTELLHEPTAAAIYYSWKHDLGDGVYLVYDLGGGTFDVSVLRRTAGDFLVLGISGDNFLGGDDFDRRLAEHLRQVLVADGYDLDLDVAGDPEDALRFTNLVAKAEGAKKVLSDQDEVTVRGGAGLRDKSGEPVDLETVVTRETFEAMIDDLLERTIVLCRVALDAATEKGGVGIEDVDNILLVGGSTYVPAVAERVRGAFCRDAGSDGPRATCERPIRDEAETAVALGAALRAAAAGIGISDTDGRVRVWFRGAAATARQRTNISGHVEALREDVALEGGRVVLAGDEGVVAEVDLRDGRSFAFPGIPIEADTLNQFEVTVIGADGNALATLGRSVSHATSTPQAVGNSLSTAVLPKPILLEGTDGDRLVRTVLLPEGTTLPTTARFTFAVADTSGVVRLPVYQASRIIKELWGEIGGTAVGTPVEVEISCDEQVNIKVVFSVGDRSFGGTIEPPPPDDVPTPHEVEEVRARFADALARLDDDQPERETLQKAFDTNLGDVSEARATADHPKLIARVANLEGLVREARLAEPLRPPISDIDDAVTTCVELIPQAKAVNDSLPDDKLRAELEDMRALAHDAYTRRDRQTYDSTVRSLTSVRMYLASTIRVEGVGTEDVDVSVRAAMAVDELRQLTQFLTIHAIISERADLFAQMQGWLVEIDELDERAPSSPVDVINRCQVIMTELRRIYQQLSPDEGTGQELKGLVGLGAQGAGLDGGALTRKSFDR